jgi:hypothetical protein
MMTASAWRAVAIHDLTKDQRLVLAVLDNATGMFKRLGYSAELIAAILARDVSTFVDPVKIRADLQQLQTRGLAVPTVNDAERWVAK